MTNMPNTSDFVRKKIILKESGKISGFKGVFSFDSHLRTTGEHLQQALIDLFPEIIIFSHPHACS